MNDEDVRLRALFGAERPRAYDAVFRLAVLERRNGRQFRLRLLLLAIFGTAGLIAVAATAIALPAPARALFAQDLWPGACIAFAILSTGWGLMQLRRPI